MLKSRPYSISIAFIFLVSTIFSLSSTAVVADPIQDCSKGCTILTCDKTTCTVWYCNHSGCKKMTEYPRPDQPKKLTTEKSVTDVEFVKVCPTKTRCDLYKLSADAATLIGGFDENNDISSELKNNLN